MMRGRTQRGVRAGQEGSALVLSLTAIATVCAIGVGIVQLQVSLERRQSSASDRRRALYVAEGGIAEASLAMSQGRSGAVGSESVPAQLGDSVYWVTSETLVGARHLLTAHAASGTQRFSIQAVVMPNVSPVGEYGFFGDEGVSIGYGAVLDGYDSGDGSYGSQLDNSFPFATTGEGVEIYSNGDIVLADVPTSSPPGGAARGGGDEPAGASQGDSDDRPGEAGDDDDSGSIATPLWDSISSVSLDPALAQGYALSLSDGSTAAPSGEAFGGVGIIGSGGGSSSPGIGSLGVEHSMMVLAQNAHLSSQAFDDMILGGRDAHAWIDGVKTPITGREYVYLIQRTMNDASAESIEQTYVTALSMYRLGEAKGSSMEESLELMMLQLEERANDSWDTAFDSSSSDTLQDAPASGPSGGGTFVFGEAVPGEDSFVSTNGDAFVGETADAQKEDLVMPDVIVPGNLDVETGTRTIGDAQVETITAQDLWIDGIEVLAGGTLVLEGPVTLAVSTLDLVTQGTLIFDDSLGPVRLYVTDRLNLAAGSLLNSRTPHEDALGTHVFVGGRDGSLPGDRVTLASSGEFHGVLYAPEDAVLLPSTLRFFGAAAAKILSIQDYAQASYDRSFATNGVGVPSLPKILSWQVVQIEEGEIKSLRFNPIMALRARGITPVPSANAAVESDFEVSYLDPGGVLRSYSGAASAFDWSNVGRLTSMRWVSPASGQPLEWSVPSGYDPDLLVQSFRADERQRIYGTAVLAHPAGVDAVLPSRVKADHLDTTQPTFARPVEIRSIEAQDVGDALAGAGGDASAGGGGAGAGTSGGGGVGPTFSEAEPVAEAEARPVVAVDGMSMIDKAVGVLNGDALDFNGDGLVGDYSTEIVGTELRISAPDAAGRADAIADLAVLGADFSLVSDGAGGFTAELGFLAPVIQNALDNGVPTTE